MSELTEWLTWPEAAAALGCSVKTIERRVKEGVIEGRKRQIPGRKPESVCSPDDIDRLRGAAHVMPESQNGAVAALEDKQTELVQMSQLSQLAPITELLKGLIETIPTQRVRLSEKLWLTVAETADYSGWSRAGIRRLCRQCPEQIGARRDGGRWKIQRLVLDRWDGQFRNQAV